MRYLNLAIGVFRKAVQSLVRPWALFSGGRLYGAKHSVFNEVVKYCTVLTCLTL